MFDLFEFYWLTEVTWLSFYGEVFLEVVGL